MLSTCISLLRSKDFPQKFILANGKIISDHKQKTNAFNDFIISIGEPECQNKEVTNTFSNYLPEKANINLLFRQLRKKRLVTLLTV